MLEISARGRREKLGEENEKRNVSRGKKKDIERWPSGETLTLALYPLPRKTLWTQVLRKGMG